MARLGVEIASRPVVRRQVAAEITAQFERFAATGLRLDHVNAHKHFHLHPTVAGQILSIGRAFGLRALRIPREPLGTLRKIDPRIAPASLLDPWVSLLARTARRAGVACPDWVFGLRWTGGMTLPRLSGLLDNLPPGVVEIYTHPATRDEFPGHAEGYRYREELSGLCHPSASEAVRRSRRRLAGYSDALL
jgi:hopanoid biosynthesis associated protein HpnK